MKQIKSQYIKGIQRWNTNDLTYKPIFDKLRELGYEIV